VIGALAALVLAAGCPVVDPVAEAAGTTGVVHVPPARALTLNNQGKVLYRQDRWAEAGAKYQAALAADPEFLAPALNAACALARQDRFGEAAEAAAALVRRSFVPWGREALEAADLAGLHDRAEMGTLRAALATAGPAWGQSVKEALFFVARTRPAVRLEGQGVLVLALNQEIFAWLPATGRYRQITAEDGRVLAAARSDDGRTVVYVRAGKLVRGQGAPRLRGLSLRRLDVPTMTLSAPIDLPGDAQELSLRAPGTVPELTILRPAAPPQHYRLVGERLVPGPAPRPVSSLREVHLTGAGVAEAATVTGKGPCAFVASDDRATGPGQVRISAQKRRWTLAAPFGAGLFGLPFDTGR
jgi:hypothetical protein